MFNQIAKQLRQPTGFLGKVLSKFLMRMNGAVYIQMVKEINSQEGDIIYEIGYGHGSGIHQLSKNANCIVDGIDFSEVMYNDAVKLNKKFIQQDQVHLEYGDFLLSEIPVQPYNKMFCVNVIYFWADLKTPFTKIKNSLTGKGTFYIYMDSLDEIKNSRFTNDEMFHLYDIDFVITTLEDLGFNSSFYDYGRGHIIKATKA